jgi:hypothetical protein
VLLGRVSFQRRGGVLKSGMNRSNLWKQLGDVGRMCPASIIPKWLVLNTPSK